MTTAVSVFQELHRTGCFVMPNPWDAGSAVYLRHLGFKALATTSAGFAFSRGLPDRLWAFSRDEMLAHVRDLVAATPLPVSADFQSGFAEDAEGVEKSVALCVAAGAAGLSIEDATGKDEAPLYEHAIALERVKAARRAIDASKIPVVLTARCEAFLVGAPDPLRTAIDRLVSFADAGADCLFAPRVRDPKEITAIVKAVSPKPVNVLVTMPGLTVRQLADLGVRRISVGSTLARTAWGAFTRAARSIADNGTFEDFAGAAGFQELDDVFLKRS